MTHWARKKQSQPFIPITVTVRGIMVATENATFEKPFFCGFGGHGSGFGTRVAGCSSGIAKSYVGLSEARLQDVRPP